MFGVFMVVVASVFVVDKYFDFELRWILDWWPVPVFLLGVYFIGAAILDKRKARNKAGSFGDGGDY